jgi:galactonate dehydratase
MKITEVEISHASPSGAADLLLVLRTDTELSGIGAIAMDGRSAASPALSPALSAMLVGRDPFDLQALRTDAALWGNPTFGDAAVLSAAGTAMADIAGRQLGIPVHQLLGGRVRDRVRACAINWADGHLEVTHVLAQARRTVDLGFTALRIEPFASESTTLDEATALIEELRHGLPDTIDLVVAADGVMDGVAARVLTERLARLEPLWLEQSFATVPAASHSHTSVPLAAASSTPSGVLQRLVMDGLVDHVLLDPGLAGGLLEARRLAALAEVYHIGMIPTGTGPVALATALHLAAAIPNITMIELPPGLVAIEDGTVAIDLRPGLGIDDGRAMTVEVA